MPDREKVIKGVIHHKLGCCDMNGEVCPYWVENDNCSKKMLGDVLDLLKEQEQTINELKEKLRLLEYGDQDILQSGMIPAT